MPFLESFQPTIVIFYWAYLVVVVIFLLLFLVNLYHLLRFGFFSFVNLGVILISMLVSFSLIAFSLSILQSFDWSTPLIDSNIFGTFLDGLLGGLELFKF
ncbi:MAG: hypothetical protein BWY53_00478 [Parcubacteria group bacterium ADurb.Bin326]|nr:MAG: hypothetical protein BWY53_00478 [Parcubacteria group bacterium ADurb.Bin326]